MDLKHYLDEDLNLLAFTAIRFPGVIAMFKRGSDSAPTLRVIVREGYRPELEADLRKLHYAIHERFPVTHGTPIITLEVWGMRQEGPLCCPLDLKRFLGFAEEWSLVSPR